MDFIHPKIIREFQLASIDDRYAYIQAYKFSVSLDGEVFSEYPESSRYVLGGSSKRRLLFDKLIFCRIFKLISLTAVTHIAVRWEFILADSK